MQEFEDTLKSTLFLLLTHALPGRDEPLAVNDGDCAAVPGLQVEGVGDQGPPAGERGHGLFRGGEETRQVQISIVVACKRVQAKILT